MKKAYIKPEVENVIIGVNSAILGEDVYGGSPYGKHDDAAEGNSSSFVDDEDWNVGANSSLWDD